MHIERPEVLQTARRRARRAKRTSGRIFVWALGFGLAYYFDTENGSARRQRLREQVRRAAHRIDNVFAGDPGVDDPPPVFSPRPESLPQRPMIRPQPESKTG
jgi:hypothetical protein